MRNVWINLSIGLYEVAGCKVTAMRVSYIDELGWELHMKSADRVDVYQAIEATCSEYSRYDAGLERFVDYDKPAFIG